MIAERSLSTPADPPATPASCRGHLREINRWEWFAGDPGDPADRLEEFLAGFGLPVRDLADPVRDGTHRVCGAAVLVSAYASAALVGSVCAGTPVPAVPDVAAVVYAPARAEPSALGTAPTRAEASANRAAWRSSWSPAEHAEAVAAVRQAIGRGDVYQVNLVGHASAAYTGDPVPALNRVAGLAGARYGGVLRGPGWAVATASPETLVEVTRDSQDNGAIVRTRPIKGTRPATRTGRAELLASPKERAEHVMIVDLERNDLARVARTGTVRVERLYDLVRWAGLWQAESQIAADLGPGVGLAALLRATCPGGSVTGAPKLAALDVIAALEPVGRGPAMGALGWVGPDRVDLGLTIRTVAADADRFHLWAGGGITWDSVPEAEVAEAAAKAAPVRAALHSG